MIENIENLFCHQIVQHGKVDYIDYRTNTSPLSQVRVIDYIEVVFYVSNILKNKLSIQKKL